MPLTANVSLNGLGLSDFGFVGAPNVDGLGLATRGFVWSAPFIWLNDEASVITGWTLGYDPSITTTWTPG